MEAQATACAPASFAIRERIKADLGDCLGSNTTLWRGSKPLERSPFAERLRLAGVVLIGIAVFFVPLTQFAERADDDWETLLYLGTLVVILSMAFPFIAFVCVGACVLMILPFYWLLLRFLFPLVEPFHLAYQWYQWRKC